MTQQEQKRIPDVLGMPLARAKEQLMQQGVSYETRETVPMKREPIEGIYRVIKQQNEEEQVVLTVCKVPDAFRG